MNSTWPIARWNLPHVLGIASRCSVDTGIGLAPSRTLASISLWTRLLRSSSFMSLERRVRNSLAITANETPSARKWPARNIKSKFVLWPTTPFGAAGLT